MSPTDRGKLTRRGFIKGSATAGGAMWLLGPRQPAGAYNSINNEEPAVMPQVNHEPFDFHPARWLWYPSQRCLTNTMVLFRRALSLSTRPKRATGWVLADSRYKLHVNGQRVQFGPAPCDPRWAEADPIDLTELLQAGDNAIGAQVLYYGMGEGTWVAGKPGFIFRLELEYDDGRKETIVSDEQWRCLLARSWRPGQYKRWYLRCLQEEFDARLYPHGWTELNYQYNKDWLAPMLLDCPSDKPATCSNYTDYLYDMTGDRSVCDIRHRSVPMMAEFLVPVAGLTETFAIDWRRPVREYFEFVAPNAYTARPDQSVVTKINNGHQVELDGDETRGIALTYEFAEQLVGWPRLKVEAPAGTEIELLVHEAHTPGTDAIINTHFHSWTRFICEEGVNEFETFDYESFRWLQLHIHGPAAGTVRITAIEARRRQFPWPNDPQLGTDEPALNQLIGASVNTLHNCAQETVVDGMARERQQYSGDVGHQLHALHLLMGETRLPARFVNTYSQGSSPIGYFIDCWPAWDRVNRIMSRHINHAHWGPILDHGIGFNFDCYHHYLYSGNLDDLVEAWPRLKKFSRYLESIRNRDGLLPVEDLGIPCVWMDHLGFEQQRHKQCSFNLYASAMLLDAHSALARAFNDRDQERYAGQLGQALYQATVDRYWSPEHQLFVDNRPWMREEGRLRLHDRTLANAILFDQCPQGQTAAAVKALIECPSEMGFSFPANACWRLWALGKTGNGQAIIDDLRRRWASLDSVRLNNTLSEDWDPQTDTAHEWSHCPVIPLYILHMEIAGIKPTAPGFTQCTIRPQLGDLKALQATARTAQGPLSFASQGAPGDRRLTITPPQGCQATLLLDGRESVNLPESAGAAPDGLKAYTLKAGNATELHLQYT